ncbi:MAG: helix-turn-helix transcriptional regulator [Oscillospiraceae bacterium]|nr:helix-turn-helix transcriptional regulator [Oscillospiraceae bacterium]
MDNAELGRRLKTARLQKKMTQSDVVGDFITRNMLSQIESGTATPSMKTLEYLAGVLEIPMEQLLSESGGIEAERTGISVLQDAKKLLMQEKYEALLKVTDPTGLFEDELDAMHSIAYLALAQKLAGSGRAEDLQAAVIHAKSAAQAAERGIYANADRVAKASLLISQLAQKLSAYYSSLAGSV